jgi:hypothetical protein
LALELPLLFSPFLVIGKILILNFRPTLMIVLGTNILEREKTNRLCSTD